MLIRGKICGDHCDRKTQSVNALLSHISKCREILFFSYVHEFLRSFQKRNHNVRIENTEVLGLHDTHDDV